MQVRFIGLFHQRLPCVHKHLINYQSFDVYIFMLLLFSHERYVLDHDTAIKSYIIRRKTDYFDIKIL